MLTFEQMIVRLLVALALGAILGIERELVGQKAGVRTEMVVSAGAALFAMIGLALPYVATQAGVAGTPGDIILIGGFGVIASVVTGIGFLGAGLIIKMNDQPHGVTTAALVWMTAAIGILTGIGVMLFATAATMIITLVLFFLRKLNISEKLGAHSQV